MFDRWAQWLAGLDFLPSLPAGLLMQGNVSQETLQDAVKSYSRERRAIHILTTLVKHAEDASELGYRPYANSPVTSVIGPCLFPVAQGALPFLISQDSPTAYIFCSSTCCVHLAIITALHAVPAASSKTRVFSSASPM